MKGWVSIHRQLMESAVWQDPFYLKLWMYCLLKASHKEHEQLIGNQVEKLQPGQFITGRKSLTEDLNKGMKTEQKLSEKSWERYLKNLEKWQMLTIKTTNKYSVITITKWNEYQESDQQLTNSCPTSDQQLTTNNNGNKGNNGNKKDSSPKRVYDKDSIHYQLAVYFFERIKENNPDHKQPNFQKWSDDIRLMIETDNRTDEQIRYLMKWVQQDDFEKANVLSPSKLRKRFDDLVMKVKRTKKVTPLEPTRESKRNNEHIEKMKKLHGG